MGPVTFIRNMRVSLKLPLIIVGLCLATVIATQAPVLLDLRKMLVADAERMLDEVRDGRIQAVRDWYERIETDLAEQAGKPTVQKALSEFDRAYGEIPGDASAYLKANYITGNPNPAGQKQLLNMAGDGSSYSEAHAKYHPVMRTLMEARGYYDVFLFNNDGDLVYSVFKEVDYATNFRTGPWAGSGLGEVFRGAAGLPQGAPAFFVDFAPYAPSNGAPASFAARPVFDARGQRLGILAVQMSVDTLNAAALHVSTANETVDSYLIGADGLLRSEASQTPETDILKTRAGGDYYRAGLDGDSGHMMATGLSGESAVVSYGAVTLGDVSWVLAASMSEDELYAPLREMTRFALVLSLVILASSTGLGLLMAREFTGPLGKVSAQVEAIQNRDKDGATLIVARRDEIGRISRALRDMGVELCEAEKTSRQAMMLNAGLEGSRLSLMMADADHNITYVNESFRKLAREYASSFREIYPAFDPEDVVGKSIHIFHKNPAHQRAILADPSKFPMETWFEIGGMRVGLNLNCVRDAGGEILGYVVSWEEVTERVKNESMLNALRDNQIMLEYELDGRISFANRQLLDRLELSSDEVVGRNHDDLVAPESRNDGGDGNFVARLAEGKPFSCKVIRRARSGARIYIDSIFNPIVDAKGVPFGFVEIGTDVTESEVISRERQATLDAIGANQAMIEFTPDGEVIRVNEIFTSAMGYSSDELAGRHHAMFVHADDRETAEYRGLWDKLARGEMQSGTFRRIAKDGSERYLQSFYTPVIGPDGKVERVVNTSTDVTEAELAKIATERRRAEEEAARARVVKVLSGALGRLADGNLSDEIERAFPEEYEGLRLDFNRALDGLSNVIRSVVDKSTGIGGGARPVRPTNQSPQG